MVFRLLIMAKGRPVAIKIFNPLALACVRATTVEWGMRWVLILTNVPSISKNNAFIIFCFSCKDTKTISYINLTDILARNSYMIDNSLLLPNTYT